MKASSEYRSLLHGVSQQPPHARGPGQHGEQINMIPDPVQGLTRRHGTRMVAEAELAEAPSMEDILADAGNYRTFSYTAEGKDYDIMYRTGEAQSSLPLMLVYNRTDGVWLDVKTHADISFIPGFQSGGISAITSVGKYVFMAGNAVTSPAPGATDMMSYSNNTAHLNSIIEIAGGVPGRTFTVQLRIGSGSVHTATYTTPEAQYPGHLDTSGVPINIEDPDGGTETAVESAHFAPAVDGSTAFARYKLANPFGVSGVSVSGWTNVDPAVPTSGTTYRWSASNPNVLDVPASWAHNTDPFWLSYTHNKVIPNPSYTHAIQQITSDYNKAVNDWIVAAAEKSTPYYIASQLAAGLISDGVATSSVVIPFEDGLRIQANFYTGDSGTSATRGTYLSVSDGGDGSLVRVTADEVNSLGELTRMHVPGKIVRVRPNDGAEVFYMKAEPSVPGTTPGVQKVTWVESGRYRRTHGNGTLFYGLVSGGTFYYAYSATGLNGLIAGDHPTFAEGQIGDTDSNPAPHFSGRKIDYLGVFQDRLVVGSGGRLTFSEVGNYLNFYRTSVVTVKASDALNISSHGNEMDTITEGVFYERSLVLFGAKNQYVISGDTVLTPTSAAMPVLSSHPDAHRVPPIYAGGALWYARDAGDSTSLHTIQPGQVSDSPETFDQSQQLTDYLSGGMIELVANPKPAHILARTTGSPNSIYVYTYLDRPGKGRVQEAWHRWDFDESLGPVVGTAVTPDGLLVFFLRGKDGDLYQVADLLPLTAKTAEVPYLDSQRPVGEIVTSGVEAAKGEVDTYTADYGPHAVQFETITAGGDDFDGTTFTAPADGPYRVQAGIQMNQQNFVSQTVWIDLMVNGVSVAQLQAGWSGFEALYPEFDEALELATGDTVQFVWTVTDDTFQDGLTVYVGRARESADLVPGYLTITAASGGSLELGDVGSLSPDAMSVAYRESAGDHAWTGAAAADIGTLEHGAEGLIGGVNFDSEVELTSPFVHSREGDAVTTAHVTVTKLIADLANTGGLRTVLNGVVKEYIARLRGSPTYPTNEAGEERISTYQQSIPVGKRNTAYTLRLKSRKWLPFALTGLSWVGQIFNRTPRV